ncbi:contractile injection system tape measure protein [Flavobacterium sp. GCM10023249]|uniref:contractile injection system tape measure protein n=1 Tax=unclassified Flavobacterium TaxID=196869 RepID=UPI0036166C66
MYLLRQNTFDIHCSSQAFGAELQLQLSSLLEKSFYPKLEQLFMKYDVSDLYWTIDKLEIELPDISKKYWKEELINKSLAQIEEFLLRNSPKTELRIAALLGNDVSVIASEKKAATLVLEFLQKGYFPRNVIGNSLLKIIEVVTIDQDFVNRLLALFRNDFNALTRWVFSVPEEYKNKVLNLLPNSDNGQFLMNIFMNLSSYSSFDSKVLRLIKDRIFSDEKKIGQWLELVQWSKNLIDKGMHSAQSFAFLNQTIEKYWGVSQIEMQEFFTVIVHENNFKTFAESRRSELEFFIDWQQQMEAGNSISQQYQNGNQSNEQHNVEAEFTQRSKLVEEESVFYINNAGLVILHPFLPMLFEQLGFTMNQEWTSELARQKAILVSHYLVFNNQEMEESQMILNKIICGWSIEEVITTQVILEENEKEKCQSLLDAVLEHWKIMRNSSKEALQETFLQREGKLEIQANGFEMWIEEKGYDILLEQLPWGIGMIKTPWMESYLICNWNQ